MGMLMSDRDGHFSYKNRMKFRQNASGFQHGESSRREKTRVILGKNFNVVVEFCDFFFFRFFSSYFFFFPFPKRLILYVFFSFFLLFCLFLYFFSL